MFKTVIVGAGNGAGDADATALAALLADPGASVTPAHIEHGSVGHGLHDAAVERGADLIVVGSSHCGLLGRIFAGDDVAATLRSAPCAVAVAPRGFAGSERALARIGVGYDRSLQAQTAMEAAKALAAREGARIRALGVATPPQGLTTASPPSPRWRPSATRSSAASPISAATSTARSSTASPISAWRSSRPRWTCSSSAPRATAASVACCSATPRRRSAARPRARCSS